MSEEEAITKIELIQRGLVVWEKAIEYISEKVLLIEMDTMKTEELRFKLIRKGLKSEVEQLLGEGLENEKFKELKSSTRKLAKLYNDMEPKGMLIAEELGHIFDRILTASNIMTNLEMSGHKNMVESNSSEVGGRFDRASSRAENLSTRLNNVCDRMIKVGCKNQSITSKASCKNPSCQQASLHRCSRCLLESYCSLQCFHLCWQEHKQLCDRGAKVRKVRKEQRREQREERKEQRREKRAIRKQQKVATEDETIQEVD